MPRFLLLLSLLATASFLSAQKPVIFPGGVVNSASYTTGGPTGKAVAPGSIASVFGENLAVVEQSAQDFPLPITLGGTSVTIEGVWAPLLYVSPRQLNIQIPASLRFLPPRDGWPLVVKSPAGTSDPFPIDIFPAFAIFTQDQSGCGAGAVLNVTPQGAVSLNTPSNSASYGDYLWIFGTGLGIVDFEPLDGYPAPSNPLTQYPVVQSPYFDFSVLGPPYQWAGRAPGWVGLDQVNVQIPETAREGCAVPLTFPASGMSQPVTISIRKGGGQCVDPPLASFAKVTWEKIIATGTEADGESNTLTASFRTSPGMRAPSDRLPPAGCGYNVLEYFGPSCPIPGYRSLDPGTVTIQGPTFEQLEAVPAVVDSQDVFRAVLPKDAIKRGSFQLRTAGGEVGPIESTVEIGAPIIITTSLSPGTLINGHRNLEIAWTGGDPDAVVTMKLMNVFRRRVLIQYSFCRTQASDGKVTLPTDGLSLGISPGGAIELVMEVTPDPSKESTLSAPGLTLGGKHTWKYTYRFGGLRMQ